MCEYRQRRRRRGGIRQRQAEQSDSDSQRSRSPGIEVDTSELGHDLIRSFAWGDLSAPDVQKMAVDSLRDTRASLVKAGARDPDAFLGKAIIRLAGSGSWGQSAQNCQKQILKDFGLDRASHLVDTISDSILNNSITTKRNISQHAHQPLL